MSWIWNPSGNPTKPQPTEEMVPDPGDPNRMVSKKAANQPFLAYHEYKVEKEKKHQAWLQRKKEREEKLARGEEVGPEERDPTAEEEIGLLGLLKFIVIILLIVVVAGKFFTGSFLWEYDGKWARLKSYLPEPAGRLFSESYLATFDGTDPDLPLYIAVTDVKIDGDVYDVTAGKATYGPGGTYHGMAGIDAARSFATGCFATHRTHDMRGLSDEDLASIQRWKDYFADHKTYFKVGKVLHRPIDPLSPIPEPCDPKKEVGAQPPKKGSGAGGKRSVKPKPSTTPEHQEL